MSTNFKNKTVNIFQEIENKREFHKTEMPGKKVAFSEYSKINVKSLKVTD